MYIDQLCFNYELYQFQLEKYLPSSWQWVWVVFRQVLPSDSSHSECSIHEEILKWVRSQFSTIQFGTLPTLTPNILLPISGCPDRKRRFVAEHGMDRVWGTNGLRWRQLKVSEITHLNRGLWLQHNNTRTHCVSICTRNKRDKHIMQQQHVYPSFTYSVIIPNFGIPHSWFDTLNLTLNVIFDNQFQHIFHNILTLVVRWTGSNSN
jgi:hypothetical protein